MTTQSKEKDLQSAALEAKKAADRKALEEAEASRSRTKNARRDEAFMAEMKAKRDAANKAKLEAQAREKAEREKQDESNKDNKTT